MKNSDLCIGIVFVIPLTLSQVICSVGNRHITSFPVPHELNFWLRQVLKEVCHTLVLRITMTRHCEQCRTTDEGVGWLVRDGMPVGQVGGSKWELRGVFQSTEGT